MTSISPCNPSTSSAAANATDPAGMTEERLKSYINSVPKNLNKAFGRWLILPEMSSIEDYRATEDKIKEVSMKKTAGFRGTFVPTTEFGKYSEGDRIPFTLLDPETSVGQIKHRVSELTDVPRSEIQIGFHVKLNLDDEMNLRYDLNCHGRGGENFWISRTEAKAGEEAREA